MIQLQPRFPAPAPAATPAATHDRPRRPAPDEPASWLEVRTDRLAHNVRALRRRLADTTRLCAVVKKGAYGLGGPSVARHLVDAGCDMLAVFTLDEAAQLIDAGIDAPMLVFMPVDGLGAVDAVREHAARGRLHPSVHDVAQLRALDATGRRLGVRLPVHLFLDTGMSRAGLDAAQLRDALAVLPRLHGVELAGIASHLACADTDAAVTDAQRTRFETMVAEAQAALPHLPRRPLAHLANSFGTLRDNRLHFDMVRCGLGLLGYAEPRAELAPVVRWLSRVIHVQRYESGASVGYGATHTLERDSVLGVVPVGYGDGYPLPLGDRAVVRLLADDGARAAECPVVGRVNMDQIVIDLTDVPAARDALLHRTVELISDDNQAPNALPRLAAAAGLHAYAMLCGMAAHVPRRYHAGY